MWLIKHHTREKYGEVEARVHAASTFEKGGIQQLIHILAALHLRNKAYHISSKAWHDFSLNLVLKYASPS